MSCELRVTSVRVKTLVAQVEILKARIEIQKCEFKSQVLSLNPRVTKFFFHLFNTKLCAVPLNYYCTINFSTLYQRWLIRQWLLISALCLFLVPSLIFRPTKQPYWKVVDSRMYRYIGMKMLLSLQIFTRN